MADEAYEGYKGDGYAGPTDAAVDTEAPVETRHGQVDVRQVEDVARASGDPYFNEFEDDPDDLRASKGTREPRPIDPGTAKLLGVEQ